MFTPAATTRFKRNLKSKAAVVAVALCLLLAGAGAWAASAIVYPFASQDPLLGVAMAEEVAAQLPSEVVVLGPEVAVGLVPPVLVADGFVSLERVVTAQAMNGEAGADVLRSGADVAVAATGGLSLRDDGAWLQLHLAHEGGSRLVELRGDVGRLDRLVWLGANAIAALIEEVTGVEVALGGAPEPTRGLAQLTGDTAGAYAGYVTAIAYLSSGLLEDAALELSEVVGLDGVPARARELRDDVAAVLAGAGPSPQEAVALSGTRLARRALLSITSPAQDELGTLAAFDRLRDATGIALADAWSGVIAASVNDRAQATTYLEAAAERFAFGEALLASLLAARGDPGYTAVLDELLASGREAGSAALLAASVVANARADEVRERQALQELRRSSPFLTYPLERLSYIAFDADEPQLAAEVLSVAVELADDSDLYWTNLGWAYYLLGFLDRSEAASLRALELDASQYIASYNVGLVRVVTGRLEAAMDAYQDATRRDPGIDDEAIADLENALVLYPDQPAVAYALAYLYEAEGRRTDARGAYQRFIAAAAEEPGPALTPYAERAAARVAALMAPLPPLEILGEARVTLGVRGPEAAPYRPGDPLYPSFELSTPGDALPSRLRVSVSLHAPDDEAEHVANETLLDLPSGAVAYVVDDLELLLPDDLAAGEYLVRFGAEANDEQSVTGQTTITVAGEAQPVRGLLGRGLMMTALESGNPLYGARTLQDPDALFEALLGEIAGAVAAAEQALPRIERGSFAGLSGGEAFSAVERADVERFLAHLLASDARSARFVFVDAFAQWLLDGAP